MKNVMGMDLTICKRSKNTKYFMECKCKRKVEMTLCVRFMHVKICNKQIVIVKVSFFYKLVYIVES